MKKYLIIFFLLFTCNLFAQEPPTFKLEDKTFVQQEQNPDVLTEYTYKDKEGNEYPIYLHQYKSGEKKGQYTCYIYKTSKKTGNPYKYYLPKEISSAIVSYMKL